MILRSCLSNLDFGETSVVTLVHVTLVFLVYLLQTQGTQKGEAKSSILDQIFRYLYILQHLHLSDHSPFRSQSDSRGSKVAEVRQNNQHFQAHFQTYRCSLVYCNDAKSQSFGHYCKYLIYCQ